ncbi:MAG: C-GCAxxG-C-C family protein, partial [Thermoleophilia bacterium]|nr:C-GCAxxG-C-C family protein [Thermoleophilia bacterium]
LQGAGNKTTAVRAAYYHGDCDDIHEEASMGTDTWQDAKDIAVTSFLDNGPAHLNCAQAVVVFAAHALQFDPKAVLAARYMGGGSVGMGHLCGALSGAILAPGLRDFFSGAEWPDRAAPDKGALQQLIRDFEAEFGTATCLGLTGHDISSKEGYRAFKQDKISKRCADYVAWTCDRLEPILRGAD